MAFYGTKPAMQRIQYDREKIIELIQRRNWNEVILLLREDNVYRELKLDPITDRIVGDYFITPLISDPSAEYLPFMEQFFALHHDRSVQFKLDDNQIKKVAIRLAKAYHELGVREAAVRYAKEAPEEEICSKILRENKVAASSKPGEMKPEAGSRSSENRNPEAPPAPKPRRADEVGSRKPEARNPKPEVTPPLPEAETGKSGREQEGQRSGRGISPGTERTPKVAASSKDMMDETGKKPPEEPLIPGGELTSSVFSSEPDYQFYAAVRDAYPSYLVFPRVAFIALVEYGLIKNALSQEERECYYKSTVDCVVFGPEDYKPIAFIENERNDRLPRLSQMKEKIIGLLGFTLYRVPNQSDRRETIRLIRQTVRF